MTRINPHAAPEKSATGIAGFDAMTGGGLPSSRTTLLAGGPGSGKTIFALQFLTSGAQGSKEKGILVAFEESADRIASNARGLGWPLAKLLGRSLHIVDAQPDRNTLRSGEFDLGGMLASLDGLVEISKAKRIVFDAMDVVLALLPNAAARREELYRVHDWLLARGMTALITCKLAAGEPLATETLSFLQFMVDCSVILAHEVVVGVSQRNIRIQKYRGSSFDESEAPFLIGRGGFEVAAAHVQGRAEASPTSERISSGIERLDTMLNGGYYRGSSVLLTGFPGTAKTTLSGAFAEAACERGEQTVFISFDSDGAEVIRNLRSVGIRLGPHVKSGRLRVVSARTIGGSAETFFMRIKALAGNHRARCVVIDPVSALGTPGNELTAHSVAERLIDWSKSVGMTLVCTSLLDEAATQGDKNSPLRISTLADTWIHLNYLVQAGERNRGLSIIKSRGTAHSNQVRELVLSKTGVTLTDAYTAGGEVLMGTMRWEKEIADAEARQAREVAAQLKRVALDAEEAELVVRIKSLETELTAKLTEKALAETSLEGRKNALSRGRTRMRELRGADKFKPPS